VFVIVVAGLAGASVDHIAFGVVFKPMSEDLGWPRSVISGAVALGTVLAGLASPFMGALGMAVIAEAWQFYVAYGLARAVATTTLMGVVPLTAMTNWFQVKRPRAIGAVSMAAPAGAAIMAQVYQATLGPWGWRGAFVMVAAMLLLVAAPAFFLLRRQPEDVGLLPDGAAVVHRAAGSAMAPAEQSWTPREALRTRSFWLIIGSFMLAALSIGTIGFHLVAYFTDAGIEAGAAASILSVYALSGGVAILLWGFVAERVHVRYLSVGILGLSMVAVLLLLQVDTAATALVFAVLYGFTARSQSTLVQILLASYFGRRFFGTISGITTAFQLFVLGVSPWVAAMVFDVTGSYQTIFTVFVGLYGLSAVCMVLASKPVRRV
jgi:sugar phosphate permease